MDAQNLVCLVCPVPPLQLLVLKPRAPRRSPSFVVVSRRQMLRSPIAPCQKTTVQNDDATGGFEPLLAPRSDAQAIPKRTRWAVLSLEPEGATTCDMFDTLWGGFGNERRHLSVARCGDAVWALLHKDDDGVVELGKLTDKFIDVYEIEKPSGGGAARNAVASFVNAWFEASSETTSNFQLPEEMAVAEVFDSLSEKTDAELQYTIWQAKQKPLKKRSAEARAITTGASHISALRRIGAKEAAKRKLQEGIVFRVGEGGTTKLVYPRDVQQLAAKKGRTFNPLTRQRETAPMPAYVETRMHFEKTLVLWGEAGLAKTPSAEAIANDIAIRYGSNRYIRASCPEALKAVQEEFERLVPIIFEDMSAGDVSQHGKKLSANYFKHLFDAKSGGQCRVRNTMLRFKPLQPRILCINDTPEAWLRAIEGMQDSDKLPLEKRLFFVHVDEFAISKEAVAEHEADLDTIVSDGKRRRLEYYSEQGVDVSTISTTASNSGGSSPALSSVRYASPVSSADSTLEDSAEEGEGDSTSEVGAEDEATPEVRAGPNGPDGKPLFSRLPEFVAVYLVFAADVLVRIGELEKAVFEHYLAELRALNSTLAKAYVETAHCSVSFLTDTTTLKLLRQWLADGQISKDTFYNIVIGQTILPSWRKMESLGPFYVEDPPSAEVFAQRFRQASPGTKAVVPSHLKQGVLGLLGKGPEVESCGRFIHDVASKIPAALERIRHGDDDCLTVLQEELGLPKFRALLVARLLSVAEPSMYDFNRRDIGDFAELGLWLLEGMPAGQAQAAAADGWNDPAVDPLFAKLVEVLPAAIAEKDRHGIIERLSALNVAPLCSQNVEHMLCEWRKMVLPNGRPASGERYEGYAELWREVAPILARRTQGM